MAGVKKGFAFVLSHPRYRVDSVDDGLTLCSFALRRPDPSVAPALPLGGEVALSSKSPKEQSFSTGKFVSVCRLGVKALQCITVGGSFRLVVGGGDGSVTVLKPFSAPRQVST